MADKHESEPLVRQFERYAKAQNPKDRRRIWDSIKLAFNDYPEGSVEIRFEGGFIHADHFSGHLTPLEVANRYYELLSKWKDAKLIADAERLGFSLELPKSLQCETGG